VKFATVRNGTRDGQLVVVSRDLRRALPAGPIAVTLQEALECWDKVQAELGRLYAAANEGEGEPFEAAKAMAPLPRAWQWLDGSAFQCHGDLMSEVFGMEKLSYETTPLMYQGVSDRFYGASDDIPFVSEADGIDFEGEYGVITDHVPIGTGVEEAMQHIRLIVLINDWSLRRLAPLEMRTGFGWVQAKPPCSVAPIAVTPDELGDGWQRGRVALPLHVWWNGSLIGSASGDEMAFSFPQLVAHAAATRDLCAGTVIGSGTVSNTNFREIGSSCLAERRAIETQDEGQPRTPFLSFGDTVRMEARRGDGASPFGALDQRVVKARTGA